MKSSHLTSRKLVQFAISSSFSPVRSLGTLENRNFFFLGFGCRYFLLFLHSTWVSFLKKIVLDNFYLSYFYFCVIFLLVTGNAFWMSSMYMMKRIGSNIDPCRTPIMISFFQTKWLNFEIVTSINSFVLLFATREAFKPFKSCAFHSTYSLKNVYALTQFKDLLRSAKIRSPPREPSLNQYSQVIYWNPQCTANTGYRNLILS